MACDTTTRTIKLRAANVSWGVEEKTCITPATGLSGGEYFKISSPSTSYAVWTSVNSVGSDPAVTGYTSIEVAVGSSYTVAEWVTAFIAAIEATDEFLAVASSDGLSVACSNIFVGAVLETITDVDTSFTFSVLNTGIGGDLGKTKEGIEVSFEVSSFDVQANQTGESILDKLITGNKASLSLSLLEMSQTKWELIVGNGYGDSKTPASGTSMVGFGTSKLNNSIFDSAGKLILHPIALSSTDYSEDVVFWKTAPLPESINYDGTDTQAMSVSFEALVDESVSSEVNLFGFGDWTQNFKA